MMGWARGIGTWGDSLGTSARARVVRLLLALVVVLGITRVVVAQVRRDAFVYAYGQFRHLDMTSFLGQEVAKRDAPGHLDSALFSLLCAGLLLLPLVRRVGQGAPWAKNAALFLSAMGGLNTLGSIAVPAPWWYHVSTILLVALTAVVVWLLWRAPVVEDPWVRADARALGR